MHLAFFEHGTNGMQLTKIKNLLSDFNFLGNPFKTTLRATGPLNNFIPPFIVHVNDNDVIK